MTIYIHKGDSTIFANVKKFLTFNIETELDLTGWTAEFVLGYITKKITDISSKSFEVILTSVETNKLRYGTQHGAVILVDSEGNTKTVVNNIPFEITSKVIENQYQEIDLTTPESSGVDIKLKVGTSGGAVNSVNGMTGNVVLNIPSIEGLATEQQLEEGLNTKQDKGDYALKEEIPDLTDYVKNTDYASASKGGTVKLHPTYGAQINSTNGIISAVNKNLTDYTSAVQQLFISKGTLENIKDDYVKRALTQNTMELTEEDKASTKHLLGYATSTDIMQAIASIPQFKLSIVEALPETGEKMTLYLVSKGTESPDVYDEYIWIEQTSSFEFLGTTAVDLTDYVKNTDYASATKGGVVKLNSVYGIGAAGQVISTVKATDDEVQAKTQKYRPIVPANLDLAVKTGVTTNTIELTDDEKASARTWLGAVGKEDYASVDGSAGLVRASIIVRLLPKVH